MCKTPSFICPDRRPYAPVTWCAPCQKKAGIVTVGAGKLVLVR